MQGSCTDERGEIAFAMGLGAIQATAARPRKMRVCTHALIRKMTQRDRHCSRSTPLSAGS
jgi:hypothetical protein